MNGPHWNNDPSKTGVTGEPAFRSRTPNYVTLPADDSGRVRTLTGKAADAHREMALR